MLAFLRWYVQRVALALGATLLIVGASLPARAIGEYIGRLFHLSKGSETYVILGVFVITLLWAAMLYERVWKRGLFKMKKNKDYSWKRDASARPSPSRAAHDSSSPINPLNWKREHRDALFAAVILGAVAGVALQLSVVGSWRLYHFHPVLFVVHLLGRSVFLSFMAAGILYIYQLLRS